MGLQQKGREVNNELHFAVSGAIPKICPLNKAPVPFANKSVSNKVPNITPIEEGPMGLGVLGSETTDEDGYYFSQTTAFGDHPQYSLGVLQKVLGWHTEGSVDERGVARVSDASYATYRAMLYFFYAWCVLDLCTLNPLQSEADRFPAVRRSYSFTPFIPPECRTSQDLEDTKDDINVAGSCVLSAFDPST